MQVSEKQKNLSLNKSNVSASMLINAAYTQMTHNRTDSSVGFSDLDVVFETHSN